MKQYNLEEIKIFIYKLDLIKNYSVKAYLIKNGLSLDLLVTKNRQTPDRKPSCTIMSQIIAEMIKRPWGYVKVVFELFLGYSGNTVVTKRVLRFPPLLVITSTKVREDITPTLLKVGVIFFPSPQGLRRDPARWIVVDPEGFEPSSKHGIRYAFYMLICC